MRKLETFNAVVKELGGTRKVAELCGRSRNVIFNWRRELGHRFPARHYKAIRDELITHGAIADEKLFAWAEENDKQPDQTAEAAA
jgi:hypothetical protein